MGRRLAVVALALQLLAALPAAAQAVSGADREAVAAVIARQIEAFRRDDGDAAFAFAAPSIRDLFMTPERFMAMVRTGYAPVYRPREFRFAHTEADGGLLVQFVAIIGPDGAPVVAAYTMERQPDGSWRIAGCVLLEPPGESA